MPICLESSAKSMLGTSEAWSSQDARRVHVFNRLRGIFIHRDLAESLQLSWPWKLYISLRCVHFSALERDSSIFLARKQILVSVKIVNGSDNILLCRLGLWQRLWCKFVIQRKGLRVFSWHLEWFRFIFKRYCLSRARVVRVYHLVFIFLVRLNLVSLQVCHVSLILLCYWDSKLMSEVLKLLAKHVALLVGTIADNKVLAWPRLSEIVLKCLLIRLDFWTLVIGAYLIWLSIRWGLIHFNFWLFPLVCSLEYLPLY